jgi:hypothetical protein
MSVTSIFTNSIANSVPVSSGINLEADMAKKRKKRTRERAKGEPYASLSKINGIRWHVNRIENLLLSIYAEHPIEDDPKKGIYTLIWQALKNCETEIINAKKSYSFRPSGKTMDNDCSCWDNNDCAPGWWCNRNTGMCEPDPPDPQRQG